MNARSVTLPNGNLGWVVPEAVQFVRPAEIDESWPASARSIIYLTSGQTVAVQEECMQIVAKLLFTE